MNGLKVIIAFVCGFFVAQAIKTVIAAIKHKKNLKQYLVKSGGMPSGHMASTTAAVTCIGLIGGFDSLVFALAVCVGMTVFYDAVNVRYAVGKQGEALNKLLAEPLKVIEGHNLVQNIVGVFLGVAVGIAVFLVF